MFSRYFLSRGRRDKSVRRVLSDDIERAQPRICRFEPMEERQLLSVSGLPGTLEGHVTQDSYETTPIHVGMVYYEDAVGIGTDSEGELGDRFELTWYGGAPGSQLTQIVLNTDKKSDGLDGGDPFFDIESGGLGVEAPADFQIQSSDGIDSVTVTELDDDGTTLLLTFTGFDAGEKLYFSVDVDEHGGDWSHNALVEGAEFEGSNLSATFDIPRHDPLEISGMTFYDSYDLLTEHPDLDLPSNSFSERGQNIPVQTAGTAGSAMPVTSPGRIAGTVYEDLLVDGDQDGTDPGISDVILHLQLWEGDWETGDYTTIDQTQTDVNGDYEFTDLEAGLYRVVEATQPTGYFSVGADIGNVDGDLRGAEDGKEALEHIEILGGDEGVEYDFGEARLAELSGYVYHDQNNNGEFDPEEDPIPGASVVIHYEGVLEDPGPIELVTDADGFFSATDLPPGEYRIEETTPEGYFDGLEKVGSAGGLDANPDGDRIDDIHLASNESGVDYLFGERKFCTLAGNVINDLNANDQIDPGEPGIGDVTVQLYDANGVFVTEVLTEADGSYIFEELTCGIYSVKEIQPEEYNDGKDFVGTAEGILGEDEVTQIQLIPGTVAENYDFLEWSPASLSGHVYADDNNNEARDDTDSPIADVTLELFVEGETVKTKTTTTDENGYYEFTNLKPGRTYIVRETHPDGYVDGVDAAGTVDGIVVGTADNPPPGDELSGIALESGDDGINYDFGEVPLASISGYVFQDGDTIVLASGEELPDLETIRDGVLDSGDTPLAGVTLILGDGSGIAYTYVDDGDNEHYTHVATTNADGYYIFEGLLPDGYTIIQMQPNGYIDSIDTPGSHGGFVPDDDPSPEFDVKATLQLQGFSTEDAIAKVNVDGGDNAVSYNFSEVKVETSKLPPPPTPNPKIPSPPLPNPPSSGSPPPLSPAGFRPPSPSSSPTAGYGGGLRTSYVWHLSILNAGDPRGVRNSGLGANAQPVSMLYTSEAQFDPTRWQGQGQGLERGEWMFLNAPNIVANDYVLGFTGATPLAGDFDGDGIDEIAVYQDGLWFIDLNGNGRWDPGDLWAQLGTPGDLPVVGDWDGDGKDDIGVYGPMWANDEVAMLVEPGLPDVENEGRHPFDMPRNIPPNEVEAPHLQRIMKHSAEGEFRSDIIDHTIQFGEEEALPIVGDWNGDGVTNIGLYRDGDWYLDMDGNGRFDDSDVLVEGLGGQAGDIPIVGDFNKDGIDDLGVFSNGSWALDLDGDHQLTERDAALTFGFAAGQENPLEDGTPVVGDFNGDGIDELAVFRATPSPRGVIADADVAPDESVPGETGEVDVAETDAPQSDFLR
jgi:serine-aspartate repeat-containing protein C/D/E